MAVIALATLPKPHHSKPTTPTAARAARAPCNRYNGGLVIPIRTRHFSVMLGKLFGFKKKSAATTPATTPQPIAANEILKEKKEKPSLQMLIGADSVETITDIQQLQQLLKNSAGLDKKTNRQLRDRLNTLKTDELQQQQNHSAQEKLCTRLETLAKLQYHPLFDSELAHLTQQWENTVKQDASIAARINTAITQCQSILTEIQQQHEAVALAEKQALEAQQKKAEAMAQKRADEEAQRTQVIELQKQTQAEQKSQHEKHKRQNKHKQISSKQHEMQDWQAFAAIPKLELLCDAMEKLCVSTLQPLETADAVRDLQAQWRAMKPPHTPEAQVLWERFKLASDKAWEPCAEHYEKARQQRAFNLQQRQTICEALEQFAQAQDWSAADWKAVTRILEKSRKEFHDFHPVERSDEKPIRTRFDTAIAAINSPLLEVQTANEARKQQLVNTAKSVTEMVDIEKAIERFQQIQEQWKHIGITRYHEDRKLWQALQEHGKVIFDKRRDNQQQARQLQDDKITQAKTLCERIAQLATLSDEELTQSTAAFEQLQSEFKAIKDIPEKLQTSIKKQFFTACDAYHQQLRGISTRQHQKQMDELLRRAQLCDATEHNKTEESAALLESNWQQHSLPVEWEKAINVRKQQALAAMQPATSLDFAANTQRRRELCIALEILLDLETPDADKQQRREMQLKKLQQGLGQAAPNHNRREQLEQLLVDWHCTGSATADEQTQLQARFDAAYAKAH